MADFHSEEQPFSLFIALSWPSMTSWALRLWVRFGYFTLV